MHLDTWIRWFMIAFFAVFGCWMIAKHTMCAQAGAFIRGRCDGTPWSARLDAVVRHRESLENLRTELMSYVVGGVSLGLAVVAALTPVPVTILYALLAVALAVTVAVGYERLRRVGGPRVASLRARDPNSVVPSYVYALTAVATVSPLAYLPVAPVAAVLVTLSGLLIAAVARGVAASPALVAGDDVPVEQYVDDRLRAVRTVNLLGTAAAPAFVFSSFSRYTDSPLHVAVELTTFAAFAAALTLQLVWMRRTPAAVEIERWSQSGA